MDEVRSYQNDVNEISTLRNLPWNKFSGKNILVTGATGLIGSCIVDILMNRPDVDFHVYAGGRNLDRAEKLFKKFMTLPYFHFIEMA